MEFRTKKGETHLLWQSAKLHYSIIGAILCREGRSCNTGLPVFSL